MRNWEDESGTKLWFTEVMVWQLQILASGQSQPADKLLDEAGTDDLPF